MNPQQAAVIAKHRLFRPLALPSAHYPRHPTDSGLVESILRWTSSIRLGDHTYDLGVKPHQIFQIQSNVLNRHVYLVLITDLELTRQVVVNAKLKTESVLNGCGAGRLDDLRFLGGQLVLKRLFFRGTSRYCVKHRSDSGWFVEDRYYFDALIDTTDCGQPEQERTTETTCEETIGKPGRKRELSPRDRIPLRPVARVFHNSVGCANIACVAPVANLDIHNISIQRSLPEYYPPADILTMAWHELAVLKSSGSLDILGQPLSRVVWRTQG